MENLDGIMNFGIKKTDEHYAFLSNTGNYYGFLCWKTLMNNKDTELCMLRIDAKQLSEKHTLFFYRNHEIVTDHVEPEYITVI